MELLTPEALEAKREQDQRDRTARMFPPLSMFIDPNSKKLSDDCRQVLIKKIAILIQLNLDETPQEPNLDWGLRNLGKAVARLDIIEEIDKIIAWNTNSILHITPRELYLLRNNLKDSVRLLQEYVMAITHESIKQAKKESPI